MSRMSTGWRRALALALTTVVGVVAVAGPATSLAQTPTTGGSIVAAIEGEPTSVDPAFDYDFVSGLATSSITEALLVFCEDDTQLCPNLATEWTVSPDGLTYTFKVRQGVTFHDGTPMTVDDVVFSLNRIRDPELGSYVGWMLANVSDVTAPDAETVVVTLSAARTRCSSTPWRRRPRTWSTRRSWRPTATSTAPRPSAPSAPVLSSSWSGSAATIRPWPASTTTGTRQTVVPTWTR